MENIIGKRIKELRTHYNLSVKEFALKCNLSHVAIFHLENGRTTKPHSNSVSRMVSVFGTTSDWLLLGKDEMLPKGEKKIYKGKSREDNFWENEAYQELKSKNEMLQKEVERLWQLFDQISTDPTRNLNEIRDVG